MQWLTILGVAIAVTVFLGSAVVFLRGSRDQGTIATLQRSNSALTERVNVLEADAARDVIERDRLVARVDALEHENQTLRNVRPSAEVIAEVAERLVSHDEATRTMLATLLVKGIEND